MATKKMVIDGLAVSVTRKRVKRLNMRIKEPDGRIEMSVPYGTADREIEFFVQQKRAWIDNAVRRVREKSAARMAPRDQADKERLRAALKARIGGRLPAIEQATGLSCSGWTVRDMRTRWGSCNTHTHHLNFSLMLAERPDDELDYVIVHELVHTVVPNHGPDFYAYMDRLMPGWKEIRRRMK